MTDPVIPTRHNARVGGPSSHADARSRRSKGRLRAARTAATAPVGAIRSRVRVPRIRKLYALLVFAFGALVLFLFIAARFERQNVGYVGVVRNGGPLDNRDVRQILLPGQRITFTGWFSQKPHEYPSARSRRSLQVTGDPKEAAQTEAALISLPTRDGVQVGLDGTLFFRFIGEDDPKVTSNFDVTIGTRQFLGPDGRKLYPWEGDEGFLAMAKALLGTVLENNLRREVGTFDCAQLVASCALVHRGRRSPGAQGEEDTNTSIAAIQSKIDRTLERAAEQTLGPRFFFDMRFVVTHVTLPSTVQNAVDQAQTQYAGVSGARAKVKQARYQAQALTLLAKAYNRSPSLARIEALKALPPSSTVILSTGSRSPSVIAGANNGAGSLNLKPVTPTPPTDTPDTADTPDTPDTAGG